MREENEAPQTSRPFRAVSTIPAGIVDDPDPCGKFTFDRHEALPLNVPLHVRLTTSR